MAQIAARQVSRVFFVPAGKNAGGGGWGVWESRAGEGVCIKANPPRRGGWGGGCFWGGG